MSRINTNVASLIGQVNLQRSLTQLQTAITRLSTGLRINSGEDDPAGLVLHCSYCDGPTSYFEYESSQ